MGLPLGTFGWGLDVDVCQIYDFISNNYEAGDELFFFGWSRGAFTVRSVAALVCEIGVLSAVNMSRFAEMWEAYRANTGGQPFRESKWYLDNKDELGLTNVKVKVVGVWDTVGALVCDLSCSDDNSICSISVLPGNPRMARRQMGEEDWSSDQLTICVS